MKIPKRVTETTAVDSDYNDNQIYFRWRGDFCFTYVAYRI